MSPQSRPQRAGHRLRLSAPPPQQSAPLVRVSGGWRRGLWAVVLAGVLVTAGCRARQAAPSPPPPSPSEATTPPAVTRIGVVDLEAVAHAHPRWRELDALNQKIRQVESEAAVVPQPPPVPGADLRPALDAEAARLKAEFDKEVQAMREDVRRQLEAYAQTLRKEQEAKFQALRDQLDTDGRQAVEAKRGELDKQVKAAELQIMDEYKYPLLNLRLRAEVAGLSSEQEAREVLRQIQALQQERQERIRAKAEEAAKAFEEFQKAKEDEVNAKLKAAQEDLSKAGQEQITARQNEMEAQLKQTVAAREREYRERLDTRRQELIRAAESQLRNRQGTFLRDVSARSRQLQAELSSLQEQRVRLEDSILAEVKIEVATIAQQEKLDVVLTRLVSNVSGINITSKVVQKLKR